MNRILMIFIGFLLGIHLYIFIEKGFSDFEIDYISIPYQEFPTKFYGIPLVKSWNENYIDDYGKGKNLYIQRPFKTYILKYEYIYAHRLNKKFDEIISFINH